MPSRHLYRPGLSRAAEFNGGFISAALVAVTIALLASLAVPRVVGHVRTAVVSLTTGR